VWTSAVNQSIVIAVLSDRQPERPSRESINRSSGIVKL
jgi:hypothetical protein